MPDPPTPDRPSDTAVRLALHRLIDALTPETAWALLQLVERMVRPPPRRPPERP
jgi:hypothetical protein